MQKNLVPIATSVIILSLLSVLYILYTAVTQPALRKRPYVFVFMRIICDAFFYILMLYQVFDIPDSDAAPSKCAWKSSLVEFLSTASSCWFMVTIADVVLCYRNPFYDSTKYTLRFHLFSWVTSAVFSVALIVSDAHGVSSFGLCWLHRDDLYAPWVFFFIPVSTSFVFSVLSSCYVSYESLFDPDTSVLTTSVRRRTLTFCRVYVQAYGVYWAVLTLVYFIERLLHKDTNDRIDTSEGRIGLIGSRGVVDLVVWLYSIEESRPWCLNRNHVRQPAHTSAKAKGSLPPRGKNRGMLLDEAHAATAVKHGGSIRVVPDHVLDVAESGSHTVGVDGAKDQANIDATKIDEGQMDLSFDAALRRDVMRTTTDGICHGAVVAELQHPVKSSNLPAITDADFKSNLRRVPLQTKQQLRFVTRSTANQVAFTDYAPRVFLHLRRQCWGCTTEEYLTSFGTRQPSGKYISLDMTERSSSGRSGAYFFFTHDKKFIVKTLTRDENRNLRRILPRYYNYILNNPETAIQRFYGCHSIVMHGQKLYFVVMDNIFPRKPHEVFDLKGSWVDRLAVKPNELPRRRSVVGNEGVLKDQDFTMRKKRLIVSERAQALLVDQIEKDASFLVECNIMDYSLLVGIYNSSLDVSIGFMAGEQDISLRTIEQTTSVANDSVLSSTPVTDGSASSAGGPDIEAVHTPLAQSAPQDFMQLGDESNGQGRNLEAGAGGGNPDEGSSIAGAGQESSRGQRSLSECNYDSPDDDCSTSVSRREQPVDGMNTASNGVAVQPPLIRQDEGGIFSGTAGEKWTGHGAGYVFYIGIIDVLQSWNWMKRIERNFKIGVLRKENEGLSAINPHAYRERFMKMIRKVIVDR